MSCSEKVAWALNESRARIVEESVFLLNGAANLVRDYVKDVDRDVRRMFGGE